MSGAWRTADGRAVQAATRVKAMMPAGTDGQAGNRAARAFSSKVESGSREENASKQKPQALHRFHETVKGLRRRRPCRAADERPG